MGQRDAAPAAESSTALSSAKRARSQSAEHHLARLEEDDVVVGASRRARRARAAPMKEYAPVRPCSGLGRLRGNRHPDRLQRPLRGEPGPVRQLLAVLRGHPRGRARQPRPRGGRSRGPTRLGADRRRHAVVGDREFLWSFVIVEMKPQPYPSFADLFYLLLYPLQIAGVVMLVWGRIGSRRGSLLLDGAIAACGAAAVGAVLLGPAIADLAAKDTLRTIVDASYPLFDVAVIGCVVGALAVVGLRRDILILFAAMATIAAADTIYLYREASTGYVEGTLLDSVWLIGASVIAFAAWRPVRATDGHEARHGIAAPAVAAFTAIVLLVVGFS